MIELFIYLKLLLLLTISSCNAQTDNKTMNETINNNPLLCNPEKGICEIPNAANQETKIHLESEKKPIHIVYFTDPICSSCWGIEPQLRKLKLEYGDYIKIEYRMGGLLPSWDGFNGGGISKPSDVAHHWDEVSHYYEMPIDGDVWLEDPLNSSYPPSIVFKAAQLQDEEKAVLFLRRIREMVFLEKKNITKWVHLNEAAKEVGLDTIQLKSNFEGKANQQFQEDLAYAKKLGVRGFPTMFFTDTLHNQLTVYGFNLYETFESSVMKLLPTASKKVIYTSWESLFNQYSSLATKEFSVLANITKHEAETLLNNLFTNNKLKKTTTKNGVMWTK
jgi:predicted DsbA family dithiol-disulfide isomerase